MTKALAYPLATLLLGLAGPGAAAPAATTTAAPERTTVPLTDPTRPVHLKAHTINGSISVKGYEGKEVVVEARPGAREGDDERSESHPGMMRLPNRSTGLSVEEQNNEVTIDTESWRAPLDLTIQVPTRASLDLGCVNDCDIVVEKVQGEVEAQNVNGSITLTGISGSALANTTNGGVTASFDRVDPGKAMSFVTLNGNVDVTLPPDTKASLNLAIDQRGDVYSDFEIAPAPAAPHMNEGKRGADGRYILKIDRAVRGTINGGGPELTLKTFNGDILLHKGK